MSGALTLLLGVVLLTDPVECDRNPVAAAVDEKAEVAEKVQSEKAKVTSAKVTSRSSDFDGKEGVVMFEGDVVVRYSDDLTMCADRLYMFVAGSNELSRVVALGNVSITNETRVGTCDRAIYRRRRGEIEMFGDGGERKAGLTERDGADRGVEGTQIRFWLDSEQVEVRNSTITSETKERGEFL